MSEDILKKKSGTVYPCHMSEAIIKKKHRVVLQYQKTLTGKPNGVYPCEKTF